MLRKSLKDEAPLSFSSVRQPLRGSAKGSPPSLLFNVSETRSTHFLPYFYPTKKRNHYFYLKYLHSAVQRFKAGVEKMQERFQNTSVNSLSFIKTQSGSTEKKSKSSRYSVLPSKRHQPFSVQRVTQFLKELGSEVVPNMSSDLLWVQAASHPSVSSSNPRHITSRNPSSYAADIVPNDRPALDFRSLSCLTALFFPPA